MLELVGADGAASVHELASGADVAEYAPQSIGLTLSEGKQILAEARRHLVQAQAGEHCRRRRICQRCQARRPPKDVDAQDLSDQVAQGPSLACGFYNVWASHLICIHCE
jgi:hypothetical protein